jgi:hypothetical protein
VASDDWQFDPPPEVLQSRLFATGGYLVIRGLFDEATLRDLRMEADGVRDAAERMLVAESDGVEGRGGFPARAHRSGEGGDLHWALHGCPQMTETLAGLCGLSVTPAGSGTYSYYEETGDFIGLHRDVLQCDIAVITALTPCAINRTAGELVVYPELMREPLSAVRAAGTQAGHSLPLDLGHTVILLGGIVPHEVAPACPGQERIVAINCYCVLTAAASNSARSDSESHPRPAEQN